ncbi:MAG: transposase family protein, partial [Gammaproteobacteria bacterium]|nr:transposase family protein [Gammaproteobacteria bacterium]
ESKKTSTVLVENRLREISQAPQLTKRYVPTEMNPADLATRGKTAEDLRHSDLWWNGPSWLLETSENRPKFPLPERNNQHFELEAEPESSDVYFVSSLFISGEPSAAKLPEPIKNFEKRLVIDILEVDPAKYSSIYKLFRVTAYVKRFIDRLKEKAGNKSNLRFIDAEEMAAAKRDWDLYTQKTAFADIFSALQKGKSHQLIDQLRLFSDSHGILRCRGRLENSDLTYDAKYPVLLPKDNAYTDLQIRSYHESLLHVGVNQTLAELRGFYWVPSGRIQVAKNLRKCATCRKVDAGPFQAPPMPSLPENRTTKRSPFSSTGMDYLGPIYIREFQAEGQQKKVWICLFTCLTVRAVHLELVADLTADQFLMCLRRFIARRSKPMEMISDNAPQFKLADSAVSKIWGELIADPQIVSYVSSQGIKWRFIPEFSPWMGGFYERLNTEIKKALKKSTVSRPCLTYIQLQTLLTEIEPLTFVSLAH